MTFQRLYFLQILLYVAFCQEPNSCLGEFEYCSNGVCAMNCSYSKNCKNGDYICPISKECVKGAQGYLNCPQLKGTHLDWNLTINERIEFLINNLSINESWKQMTNEANGIDRLGIPFYNWRSNDIHSERNPHSTLFPDGCGLGSMWSKQDMRKVANIIGLEARSIHNSMVHKGNRVGFNNDGGSLTSNSPNINLVRDPRWGRAQEVWSEDPRLTGHLAYEFITGIQYGNNTDKDNGYYLIGAQCKHFGVYDLENIPVNRLVYNAKTDAINYGETYIPAFRECITRGQASQVMCSYNSVNGIPACGNEYLLNYTIKNKWGFDGLIVSDYDAWYWIYGTHHYANNSLQALIIGLNAGCDMEGGGNGCVELIPSAIANGNITMDSVNNALRRIWRVRLKLGVFDPPTFVEYNKLYNDTSVEGDEHLKYARNVVAKSICLYKNSNDILPLNKDNIDGILFVGPQGIATDLILGNYYTYPDKGVPTIIESLRNELDSTVINPDCVIENNIIYGYNVTRQMTYTADECQNTCFQNDLCKYWSWIPIPNDPPPQGTMGINCNMTLNGTKIMKQNVVSGYCNNKENLINSTKVRYINGCYNPKCESTTYFDDTINTIINLYKSNKLSHIFIGIGLDQTIESEGQNNAGVGYDRSYIELPGYQNELISLIYNNTRQYNIPLICVLIHGGTMALGNAYNECDTILDVWYPGSQGALGLMDVIFGRYNPAGRAPVTTYLSTDQLPAMDDQNLYPSTNSSGITYRYFNGDVLFPFGYGLSYTEFEYSQLSLNTTKINDTYYILNDACGVIKVSFNIKNIGKYIGDEVTQLYIKQPYSSTKVPNIRLGDFERIELININEIKSVDLILTPQYRSVIYNDTSKYWYEPDIQIENGIIEIYVGGGQPLKPFKGYLYTQLFVNDSKSFHMCQQQN